MCILWRHFHSLHTSKCLNEEGRNINAFLDFGKLEDQIVTKTIPGKRNGNTPNKFYFSIWLLFVKCELFLHSLSALGWFLSYRFNIWVCFLSNNIFAQVFQESFCSAKEKSRFLIQQKKYKVNSNHIIYEGLWHLIEL